MLKFLRQYSKWMLALFACFLMIGFLLPSTGLLKDSPDQQGKTVVAVLADGRKFTIADRRRAHAELSILATLTQDNALLYGQDGGEARDEGAANRWLLIQAEAENLGINAGEGEVNSALYALGFAKKDAEGKTSGGLDEVGIAAFCARSETDEAGLRQALKSYLRAESLRQLLAGSAHDLGAGAGLGTPGLQRLMVQREINGQNQQADMVERMGMEDEKALEYAMRSRMIARRMVDFEQGAQRLSTPLLAHQLQNLNAQVSGKLVVVPAATPERLARQPEPTEAQLLELFEPLKNSPRGSAPYGFGYRLPARLKIEALVIPAQQAKQAAEAALTEDQVRDYFEEHAAEFAGKAGETPTLTAENRQKARQKLLVQETAKQALAFARTAEQVLDADWRTAAAHNNQLPADAAPTPFQAAADAILAKHGFAPQLLGESQIQTESVAALTQQLKATPLPTAGGAEGWLTPEELFHHPLLGQATLAAQSRVSLPLAANHLAGGEERHPLPSGLALAVNLRLPTALAKDGSCILARIRAADAPRPAASAAEVRPLLVRDAKELAAFRALSANSNALRANVVAQTSLEKFASAADRLFEVPALTRVDAGSPGAAPQVPGVGESPALVAAVFDRAETLRAAPGGVKGADLADRLIAVPLENQRAVVLFELRDYAPIAKSRHRELAQNPISRFSAHAATIGSAKARDKASDPLAEEHLKQRLGWIAK